MSLATSIIRGAITTDTRQADIHPEDWRRRVYEQMPVGRAPLTAMLLSMPSTPTPSRFFNWPSIAFNSMRGDITDILTAPPPGGAAYTTGGVAGTQLYAQMSVADAKKINVGDNILIANDDRDLRVGRVNSVVVAGATSSYAAFVLRETDTGNALADTSLTWRLSGHSEAEMSPLPKASGEEVEWFQNCAGITMESIEISGTEQNELSRIDPAVRTFQRARALQRFNIKLERNLIFGIFTNASGAGLNGKDILEPRGIRTAISEEETANMMNYKTDTDFSGQSWLSGGMDFLNEKMEILGRFGEAEFKKMYVGGLAWLAINNLIADYGMYQIERTTDEFGVKVNRIHGLTTGLDMILHPLFSEDPAFQRSALIVEPELLRWKPMMNRDVQFVSGVERDPNGWTWVDGVKEGWFAQAGLEYDNLAGQGWMDNLGVANTV